VDQVVSSVEGHLEISNDQVKKTNKVKENSFKMLEKRKKLHLDTWTQ
jgi:hypothetical protein